MKVRDRMTTNVLTVEMDSNAIECYKFMKDKNIRRLPVMNKNELIGIVTTTDLDRAAPSAATTLSKNELNYLLAKMTIKDVIPRKQELITIDADNYIESAAKLMRQYMISGLPVLENGKVVGIITETDLFDAFVDILGVKKAHTRIDIYTEDRLGTLAKITGIIAEKGRNILNTVVYYDKKKDKFKINLRLEGLGCDDVVNELKENDYEIDAVTELSAE